MPFLQNEFGRNKACREEDQGENGKEDGDNKKPVRDALAANEVGSDARGWGRRRNEAAVCRIHPFADARNRITKEYAQRETEEKNADAENERLLLN
jgi:hypothetical protein